MMELKGRFSKASLSDLLWDYEDAIKSKYPHFYAHSNSLKGTSILGIKLSVNPIAEAIAYGKADMIECLLEAITGGGG